MLSHEDNETMCRVGRGTAMGTAMRRFWTPALQSDELPVGGDEPVLIDVLGERLVAFRDDQGRPGILAEACCHRGVSLGLGRVENCGLRCIYHGWLYDVNGQVLETPNIIDPKFKDRVKQRAYPVCEAGGLIWVYLGEAEALPNLPDFGWVAAPEADRLNVLTIVNANYVQVLEGILDSSHLSVLHKSGLEKALGMGDVDFAAKTSHMFFDSAPRIEAELTDWGLHYAALRSVKGKQETRVTTFVSPFFVLNPNADLFFAVVPMSDERTAFFHIWWSPDGHYGDSELRKLQLGFVGLDQETQEKFNMTRATCDAEDAPSRQNRWKQDRDAMRAGHFTGLTSFTQEDALVASSSGTLRDRSHEMLTTADLAISLTYRALLRNAREVAAGREPAAAAQKVGHLRGASAEMEPGEDWRTLVPGNFEREEEAA
jgi:phthalate 4,5-dioxygenase